MVGGKPRVGSSVSAGKDGNRDFHLTNHVCGRAECAGGVVDDGDGQSAGRGRADVNGLQAAADSTNISLAGCGDRGDRNDSRVMRGLFVRMGSRDMALDSTGSASICGGVCAVSSEFAGRTVDRSGGYGDFSGRYYAAGACSSAIDAGGDSAL